MRAMFDRIGRFATCEEGGASVEFVILFLPIVYLIFTIAELGVFMMRVVSLERGVDMAMRAVRLDIINPGEDETEVEAVRREICRNAFLISNCDSRITIEVTPLTDVSDFDRDGGVRCVNSNDPDLSPVDQFTPPGAGQITFVRVCLVSYPIFPGVGLGAKLPKLETGGYGIVFETAFMNEP